MNAYVMDSESDGFLRDATKIHCIALKHLGTGDIVLYEGKNVEIALQHLSKADAIIGHNICGHDIPLIRKLYPTWNTDARLIDTLLVGNILYPEEGFVSLETWAEKLSLEQKKIQHEDWTTYTPEMGNRCVSDVEINTHVYNYFGNNKHYPMIKNATELESQVALIHAQQTLNGITFNVLKAIELLNELDKKIEEVRKKITELAPKYIFIPGLAKKHQSSYRHEVHDGVNPFKKDGEYTQATLNYFGEDVGKVKGSYSKIEVRSINLDSTDEVKELLLSLGWKPTEWNKKIDEKGNVKITSPKLTEDSYGSLPEGLGKKIAEYNIMSHRRSFLLNKKDKSKGALADVMERGDGRVSADAFTCGTPTARYRHKGTVCNIPRPGTPYGKELRALFKAAEGCYLIGIDLSGIEARCLCHFLLNGNYKGAQETASKILSGDFHTENAKMWGIPRDLAKNTVYAIFYGAGAKRVATTAGVAEKLGAKMKKDFYKAHPGIAQLIEDLERAYDARGFIKSIDGRPLYVRRKMDLLNTLLQHTATLIFKKWMVAIHKHMASSAVYKDVKQLIAYHDELQFESDSLVVATSFASMCEYLAIKIGGEVGIRVPIEAVAKIGMNWNETH